MGYYRIPNRCCNVCGIEYHPKGIALQYKYCSNKCKGLGLSILQKKKGTRPPSQKGRKPNKAQLAGLALGRGWNSKGIKRPISEKIRKSGRYRRWRWKVFCRDDFTCQSCKTKGDVLNAHHIKPFSLYPKLRFLVNNGVTLCVPCHKKTDTYGGKLINKKYARTKNKQF